MYRLKFEMGPQQGVKELDIRVPTSGMRDRFLATLTQVRRELSERSPSPPKIKTARQDFLHQTAFSILRKKGRFLGLNFISARWIGHVI